MQDHTSRTNGGDEKTDINVYMHGLGLEQYLKAISEALQEIKAGVATMNAALEALSAQVTENTNIEKSAVQLLKNISEQLAASKDDPAAIQALADQLKASSDALSQAIIANTPVDLPKNAN